MKQLLLAAFLLFCTNADAQVGVGTTGPQADLDIVGDTVGLRNGASWDNLWFTVNGNTANINASGSEDGLNFRVGANGTGTYGNGQTLSTAMTIMPSGRVGINTPLPQAPLDVAGTARAQSFNYASAQTRYWSIPFDAFASSNESAYKIIHDVQSLNGAIIPAYMRLNGGTGGQPGYVSAPVNLPQGATITSLELTAEDNDGTTVVPQVSLVALGVVSGSIALSVPLSVTATLAAESPNWQVVSSTLNHAVHNDLYVYKVVVRLNQNSFDTKLHGVRITYTVSSPD